LTTTEVHAPSADAVLLAAAVAELEARPVSALRTLTEPATAIMQRAQELGETELEHRARLLVVSVMVREGRIADGGRAAHEVLAWAQPHGSPYLLARVHRELSMFFRLVGDVSSAHTHALHGVRYLPADVDPGIRTRHVLTLAVALDENGHSADGDRRFTEALDLALALGDGELIVHVLNNIAYTEYERGNEPHARVLTTQMREVAAQHGFFLSAGQLDTVARVEMMRGDFGAAAATLWPALGTGSTVAGNEGDALATCFLTMAEALRLDGRFAEAQAALDAGARMAIDRDLKLIRAQFREGQARLYADTGRYREAYEEHCAFYTEATALHSAAREARAHALQAVFDATEARRASETFREMAHRDALTGLHNRRHVNERLPALLGESAATRTPLAVAIVDLDHFKRVNDELSHDAGDTVLQHLAALLTEAAPEPAVAARMGGEEFVLLLPGTGLDAAEKHCDELRWRIRTYDWSAIVGDLPVTASIGVTVSAGAADTPSSLLSAADRNLYIAKRSGRNRVVAVPRN
jgi:diguanylate cyclase (GGDEF)-like protein